MRLAGWILLLVGMALCASVAWAALGFMLMGVGLVSLTAAEQKRKRMRHALAGAEELGEIVDDEFEDEVAPPPRKAPSVRWERTEPTLEPAPVPAPPRLREWVRKDEPARPREENSVQALAQDNSIRDNLAEDHTAPAVVATDGAYDKAAWQRLRESDPDLSQLALVLSDYGDRYVDELAAQYMAAPDKSRLGAIVDGIMDKARGDAPQARAARPKDETPPAAAAPAPEPLKLRDDPKPVPVHKALPVRTPAPPPPPPVPASKPQPSLIESVVAVAAVAAASPSTAAAAEPTPVDPPKPKRERDDTLITSADDDLSELIRKFAPDSNFLSRS